MIISTGSVITKQNLLPRPRLKCFIFDKYFMFEIIYNLILLVNWYVKQTKLRILGIVMLN